eukprot:5955714-Heterocapsa_arctica.AAC.1
MGWGGKSSGSGWNCQQCGFHNHHSNPNCAGTDCQTWGGQRMNGWTEKGSPKGKGSQQNWNDFGPSGKGYGYSGPSGKGYGDQYKGKTDWN